MKTDNKKPRTIERTLVSKDRDVVANGECTLHSGRDAVVTGGRN